MNNKRYELKRARAASLYLTDPSKDLKEVSKIMEIPYETVRSWSSKYDWKKRREEKQAEIASQLIKIDTGQQIRKMEGMVSSIDLTLQRALDRLATSDKELTVKEIDTLVRLRAFMTQRATPNRTNVTVNLNKPIDSMSIDELTELRFRSEEENNLTEAEYEILGEEKK